MMQSNGAEWQFLLASLYYIVRRKVVQIGTKLSVKTNSTNEICINPQAYCTFLCEMGGEVLGPELSHRMGVEQQIKEGKF